MKRIQSALSLSALFVALAVMTGCDKYKEYDVTVPKAQVHFVGTESQNYSVVVDPAPIFNIIIGTTDVGKTDRTVSFNITSPTGAQAGREYTVQTSGNSVVIPAGETRAIIPIQGDVDYFRLGEKHQLVVTLSSGDVEVASFLDTLKINMRGPCFDSDIVFTDLLGSYTRTYENGTYGPYTSTIDNYASINATSASARINNLYDSGIPATAVFDFSTVGNYTVTIPDQTTGFTAGGLPLRVRSLGTDNKFTYCTPTFRITIELYTSAGTFDTWVMTMAR